MNIINKIDEALNEAKMGNLGTAGEGIIFDTFGGSINIFLSQDFKDESFLRLALNSSSRGSIDHIIKLKEPREVDQRELYSSIKGDINKGLKKIADKFDKDVAKLIKSYDGKY